MGRSREVLGALVEAGEPMTTTEIARTIGCTSGVARDWLRGLAWARGRTHAPLAVIIGHRGSAQLWVVTDAGREVYESIMEDDHG